MCCNFFSFNCDVHVKHTGQKNFVIQHNTRWRRIMRDSPTIVRREKELRIPY